jgi:hypothetical protein
MGSLLARGNTVQHGLAGEADGILSILCKMDVERARIAQLSFVNLIGLRKASSAVHEKSGENPAAYLISSRSCVSTWYDRKGRPIFMKSQIRPESPLANIGNAASTMPKDSE